MEENGPNKADKQKGLRSVRHNTVDARRLQRSATAAGRSRDPDKVDINTLNMLQSR